MNEPGFLISDADGVNLKKFIFISERTEMGSALYRKV